MQTESPTRADFTETIQRCTEAYRRATVKRPRDCHRLIIQEFDHNAYLAFCAHLPILCDLASIQLYIACIAQGAAIGAIDPVDVGRLCHVAQTAMSAWKMANLTLPAAKEKERQAQTKEARHAATNAPGSAGTANSASPAATTPLPPKGNHPGADDDEILNQALQRALENLPTFEVQKEHFKLLREHGIILPGDKELRDNPLAALHFCRVSEQILRKEALAENPPRPQPKTEPAPDPKKQPQQAA